ncbi:ATP-binding protein [Xanthomonas sacchari]|nr:ATP-binding protein [Xanthomonas sacchari]
MPIPHPPRRWRCWGLACLLALAAVCADASAAVPELPRFRVFSGEQGLPSSDISGLQLDRDGYLWIASGDGLARYDGREFRVWRHDPADPASLRCNYVQDLHIDARDRIWVACEGGGLSMLGADRRGFRHFNMATQPAMRSDDVFAIASRGDAVYFGTYRGGLYRLGGDGRVQRIRAGDPAVDALLDSAVLTLAFDDAGVLWVGTFKGLVRYDGRHASAYRIDDGLPQEEQVIMSITRLSDGLWFSGNTGLFRRDRAGRWLRADWIGALHRAANAIAEDGAGGYWLGNGEGLWHKPADGPARRVDTGGAAVSGASVVETVLRDREGGLWVPLPTRGLGYLRPDWRRLAVLGTAQGLPADQYVGLATARAGGVWLLGSGASVFRLDTTSGALSAPHWANRRAERALAVGAGRPARGVVDGGQQHAAARPAGRGHPAALDPRRRRGRSDSGRHAGLAATGRTPAAVDRRAGLRRAGARWRRPRAAEPPRRPARPGRHRHRGVRDGAGRHAVGRRRTVPALGRRGRAVPHAAGTGRREGAVVRFADARTLWVHRLSGLELWRRTGAHWQRSQRYAVADGLPATESSALVADSQGRAWLGMRRGLFRVDPQRTPAVRAFGTRDGLGSQELVRRGLLMTADGVLVAAAADGSVALLDTQQPDPVPVPLALSMESVQVRRGPQLLTLPTRGDFTLRSDDRDLRVAVRLLSYIDPEHIVYRFRLPGYDRDWVSTGASGERTLPQLPDGAQVLEIQARTRNGAWSPTLRLPFRVQPPWWRSVWGIVGLLAAAGLLLLMSLRAYRRRLGRQHAWELALHKQELAEQASLAKTRFLATLGHEVRTPLTGVLGMSELLLATPLDPKQRGYTESIRRAGTHLLHLVNDALDLARIEAGRLRLESQPFALQALIAEVVNLMAPLAQARGLRFDLHDGMPGATTVEGDALRVRQILLNLLGNAIKFTSSGSVALKVAPGQDGQGLCIEVADTGPGIGSEQQARLFQRFEQGDGPRTAVRQGGSGLGLAISQELAMAMGGRIQVESRLGHGARFRVGLPLRWRPAQEPAAVPVPAPRARTALRILLVEDEPTVAQVMVELLRGRGHQVTWAAHGLEALTEASQGSFDIGLLDLDLPALDGLALARQLRALGHGFPLLAVTARSDGEAEAAARAAGFAGFVRKPVTGQMLEGAIDAVLDGAPPPL